MNEDLQSPRVLLVLNDLRMGGSERQALWLAGALRRRGIDAGIVGFCPPGVVTERCRAAGIPCASVPLAYPWSRWYTPFYLLRVLAVLRRLRPHVIMAFTSIPNAYCGVLWRAAGARAFIWNQRNEGLARPGARIEAAASRRVSFFVANSRASAAFLTEKLRVDPRLVRRVPNAVEAPAAPGTTGRRRRELGIRPSDVVVCMVGNLRPPKDHLTLLEAWRMVCADPSNQRAMPVLLLAGRPDADSGAVVSLAETIAPAGAVRVLGYEADVSSLLRECDIAAFSSRSEGSPNAVLESMAAGLPVVATDIPALRECLPAEQSSLLCPPGDARAMADALSRLISAPAWRATLGETNRRHVLASHAPGLVLDRYTEVLNACCPDLFAARPSGEAARERP